MNSCSIRLLLGRDVRATLIMLLTRVLELPEGSRVVDHLPINPWGDVEAFRQAVFLPLHGQAPLPDRDEHEQEVILEPDEVKPIRDVLDGLAESISGGVPWTAVTTAEREAIERLLSRLAPNE